MIRMIYKQMKVLIIYSTKNGCARECASILASHIEDNFDVTLWDLATGMPDLSDYGFVVLGGGVHFGKFYKPMQQFLSQKSKELTSIPHALYLCCADMEMAEHYIEKLFPASLRESALSSDYFGGWLKTDKHKGLWKLVIKLWRDSLTDREEPKPLPDLLDSNISLLATKIVTWRKERDE